MSSGTESELVGRTVTLTVSDPWELVDEIGVGPHPCRILRVGSDAENPARKSLLVEIVRAVSRRGVPFQYLIASTRSAGQDWVSLEKEKGVDCGFIRIPPERAESADPFDLSWWRGGDAFLGNLSGANHGTPAGRTTRSS